MKASDLINYLAFSMQKSGDLDVGIHASEDSDCIAVKGLACFEDALTKKRAFLLLGYRDDASTYETNYTAEDVDKQFKPQTN